MLDVDKVPHLFNISGDNMLTAVSVARDCGMVAARSKVIMVNATAPGGDRVPQIEWSYDTAPEKGMEQSTGDVQTQDQVGYMFQV